MHAVKIQPVASFAHLWEILVYFWELKLTHAGLEFSWLQSIPPDTFACPSWMEHMLVTPSSRFCGKNPLVEKDIVRTQHNATPESNSCIQPGENEKRMRREGVEFSKWSLVMPC